MEHAATPQQELTESLEPSSADLLASDSDAAIEFVTFIVGEQEYGVDIMRVREIKSWSNMTKLPNQPAYMRGVINLRGAIVPVFDLRARFSQGLTEAGKLHVVMIVSMEDRSVGILVDAVSDILKITNADILPTPEVDGVEEAGYLAGLVHVSDHLVTLLELDRLFDGADVPDGAGLEALIAEGPDDAVTVN